MKLSSFFLAGIDPALNHFDIKLFDFSYVDQIQAFSEVAATQICFIDICSKLGQTLSLPLRQASYVLFGHIQVSFKITGPGSTLCGKCGFYLGFDKSIQWKALSYHAPCVSCENCRTRLAGTSFKIRDGDEEIVQFYCNRCHDKKFGDDTRFTSSDITINAAKSGINDHPHTWEVSEPGPMTKCGFCGDYMKTLITKGSSGFQCTACKYPCHKECKDFIPEDCTKDSKTCIQHGFQSDSDLKKSYRKSLSKVKSFSAIRASRVDKGEKGGEVSDFQVSAPVLVSTSFDGFPSQGGGSHPKDGISETQSVESASSKKSLKKAIKQKDKQNQDDKAESSSSKKSKNKDKKKVA